ncbi:MAG: hypothetical protein NTW21_16090 [Verrucomicrobia bacterium]|nr:hypothetical protein [Verrucomicrobiota bacterium]
MKTNNPSKRHARPLLAMIPAAPRAGLKMLISGKAHWLKPLAIFCCLVNAVSADTLGLFTYTDNGTYLVSRELEPNR